MYFVLDDGVCLEHAAVIKVLYETTPSQLSEMIKSILIIRVTGQAITINQASDSSAARLYRSTDGQHLGRQVRGDKCWQASKLLFTVCNFIIGRHA